MEKSSATFKNKMLECYNYLATLWISYKVAMGNIYIFTASVVLLVLFNLFTRSPDRYSFLLLATKGTQLGTLQGANPLFPIYSHIIRDQHFTTRLQITQMNSETKRPVLTFDEGQIKFQDYCIKISFFYDSFASSTDWGN